MTTYSESAPQEFIASVDRLAVERDQYPEAEEALLRAAFRLGAAMCARPDINQVTSPVSALYALAMLRAGAGTTTAGEMDSVLGLPNEHRDEAMNALLATLEHFDGDPGEVDDDEPPSTPLLHLATAVFVPADGATGRSFLEVLARHYGSGVHPVDFADPATAGRINAWVSEETGGRIREAPLAPGPETTLSLLSAVYFAAAWDEPFEASMTADAAFTTADGSTVTVPMMHGDRWVRLASGENWTGIDLPYGDGFFFRLILPSEGAEPHWTEPELLEIARRLGASGEDRQVTVILPTWDHDYAQDLVGILMKLGLHRTLGSGADFEAIRPGTSVSGAVQAANITVAEEGTVAAAVTQLMMMKGLPMPPEVTVSFDRPFGYQIVHEETGLPVFMGTVADPR